MRKFITLFAVLALLATTSGATASARQYIPDSTVGAYILEDGSSGQAQILFADASFISSAADFVLPAQAIGGAEPAVKALTPLTVKELKQHYSLSSYRPQADDLYNPASAALESLIIPGLGQIVTGYAWRGFAFLATESVLVTAATVANTPRKASDGTTYTNPDITYVCLGLALATHVWSIVDAVQVAKLKNLHMRSIRQQQCRPELSLMPYVTASPDLAGNISPQAGVGLNIRF